MVENPFNKFANDYADNTHHKWPAVRLPYSGELKLKAFWYDWEERKLESFHDLNIHAYVDDIGNRALRMATWNHPLMGKMRDNTYIDFTEKTMVWSNPEDTKECFEFTLPHTFNIRDYIDKLKTEEGEITTYLGTKTVRWEHGDKPELYHTFRLDQKIFDMDMTHIVYFDWKTNELSYIEVLKPVFMILEIENGIHERKFTDEDFKDVMTECPKKPKFFSKKKNQ